MFRRSSKESKAKLEHKLYLARETPEPVFDLSDCDLKQVPSGIYSLCRVFLKEALRLENNQLGSLSHGGNLADLNNLRVLDIHCNKFTHLPQEIDFLTNLKELYISDNLLKLLPDSVCHLKQLQILDVSNNQLKKLPEDIGFLTDLHSFNINGNKRLKILPKSMHKCSKLATLQLDSDEFEYPPEEVVRNGIQSIMTFICDDIGAEYVPGDLDTPPLYKEQLSTDDFEAKIWTLEAIKKQKLLDFLEIEKQNEFQQRQEFELAMAQKANREQLLADITQQQDKIDRQLVRIQHEKEVDRFRLIEQLVEAENNAEKAVKQLLQTSYHPHAKLLEFEKQEEERLLAAATKYSNETLRKADILEDMNELLQQELKKFEQFHQHRTEISKGVLEQDMLADSILEQILRYKDTHKSVLISQLQLDAELQKAAVSALLERGDARSWGLVQQVLLVESQLAALTTIEMDRKRLQLDEHLNDLAQKRIDLSILLIDLLEQQKERRMQLLTTLELMEESTSEAMEDFWLKQYQSLLDKLPEGLSEAQKNMDPDLVQSLLLHGVLNCLPFLAKLIQCRCQTAEITTEDLSNAGIVDPNDQRNILEAFNEYQKGKEIPRPSAPIVEATAPVSAEVTTSECVVCMDLRCEIIYVPCGHFCCCETCSATLVDCPMCRAEIERKIRVISS